MDLISQQAGLYFTEKANVILVQKIAKTYQVALDKTTQADTLVKGVVRDAEGLPLQNVTVAVKGTSKAVQTGADGTFAISVPANATLVFTFVGYSAQEVKVDGQSSLSVSMAALNKDLNEVVVVGYQPQRRADLAGAVSVVNAAGVAKLPVAGLDQALQGKAAGVRITQATGQPGEGVVVRIRGVGTINNNDPLFIIDGVPTKDGINFLSPNDIESIIVLKDASSAAIYGARAANGVVVVTTKNGKRGKPQFSYSGYYGIQTHGTLPKMLNTPEYVELYNEAVVNDNMDITNASLKRKLLPDSLPMANTDWLDAIFQNGMIMSHELSVAGGSDKVRYYISGNYFKQDGILLNSWYERYALLSKLNMDLTSRLTVANNINLSYTKKNMVGSSGDGYGGNGGSVIRYALFRTPAIPVYNGDGTYSDFRIIRIFLVMATTRLPWQKKQIIKKCSIVFLQTIYAEYKILKNLSFKSDAGLDAIITDAKRFDENYGTNLRINSPSRLIGKFG